MLGEHRAGNSGAEDDAPTFLQSDEGIAPDRMVRGTTGPGDRDQPAALGQPRQGRRDVPQGGIGHAAIDVGNGREWRIHQHNAGSDAGSQMIVDVRGVEARYNDAGKEKREKFRAGFGELVENERCARQLGQNGEQTGTGRRLQHDVIRRDRSRGARRKPKYNGCTELLKRFALFRAAGVGGKKAGDFGQHRQHRGRGRSTRAHGRTELANEQNGRRLAGVVSCLPVPSAVGVGGAKGVFHRRAQHRRIDALTALEMHKKMVRGPCDRAGLRHRTGRNGKRRGRVSGHGDGSRCHGENLERAGEGLSRGALSRPRRLKPVPAALFLSRPGARGWYDARTSCGAAEATPQAWIIRQR